MACLFLSASASLVEDIDKKVLVVLRDGRNFVGILRCVDSFSNLVLGQAVQRIHVGKHFGEINEGMVLVRGENVMLMGEVDEDRDQQSDLIKVPVERIRELKELDKVSKDEEEVHKNSLRLKRGLPPLQSDMQFEDFI